MGTRDNFPCFKRSASNEKYCVYHVSCCSIRTTSHSFFQSTPIRWNQFSLPPLSVLRLVENKHKILIPNLNILNTLPPLKKFLSMIARDGGGASQSTKKRDPPKPNPTPNPTQPYPTQPNHPQRNATFHACPTPFTSSPAL